ncbi:MAG: hypothetical protein AAB767_01970 [Patescibacteria group bacterium]
MLRLKVFPVIVFIILIFAVSIFIFRPARSDTTGTLDSFAQCLDDNGFIIYGAYGCPHCQREKAAFGDSFKYAPYMECTEGPGTAQCTTAGMRGYPT